LFDDLVSATSAKNLAASTDMNMLSPSEFIREKVKGIIPLDLQVSRPDVYEQIKKKKICLTDALPNPTLPSTLGNVPRLPRIKFSRSMPRKDIVTETAGANCPQYNPNHEFIKKSLGQVGAKFDRVTGRRELARNPYYTNETVYDYDEYVKKNKSHVYAKVNHPSFDKMMPRERYPESKYPAYLQTLNTKASEPTFTRLTECTDRTRTHLNLNNSVENSVL